MKTLGVVRLVGSSPFMFDEWKAGQEIRLVRNPDYVNVREDRLNKGAPYVDGIIYKNVPEIGTRIAAIETGEINVLGLSRKSVPRFMDDPEYKVITAEEPASMNFIEFNYTRTPFDNPEFQQAFGLAIDKKAILAGAYGGFASLNYNPYPNGNPGHDLAIGEEFSMHYDPEPEKAKALLDELGWRNEDGDGILEAHGVEGVEDGAPAEFTCWTYPFEIKQRECEIVQANLKDVDINVQLTDFGTMSAEMPKGEFDFDVMRWTWSEPVILSLLLKCPGWKELHCDSQLDEILNRRRYRDGCRQALGTGQRGPAIHSGSSHHHTLCQ